MNSTVRTLALVATLGLSGAVHAALPTGTLTFIEPTGTAKTTDNIEVWLRLSIDQTSVPLFLDSNQPQGGLSGVVPSDFDTLDEKWVSIDSAQTNTWFMCSGTFTNVCSPGAYQYEWNLPPSPNSFNWMRDINLQSGQSLDYHFVTFKPVGGAAAPGTYWFYGSGATLAIDGKGYKAARDENGQYIYDAQGNFVFDPNLVSLERYHDIASTNCGPNSWDICPGFSREVVAVPEPEAYAMLVAGLGLIGFMARRKKLAAI